MIAIIDYDAGNLKSVEKALAYLGEESVITRDFHTIEQADKVILPGVGSFGVAMDNLKALLTDHLREPPDSRADGNLHHAGVDTKLPGVLGKFTLAETDEPHLLRLSKTMQQRQHVRLRAADVAARDQCYHFHIGTLIFELPLVSCGKIQ